MRGYCMFPDIYGDDIIFVTEDDLWKFSRGVGVRLTSDFGVVVRPKFSPDGRWIAFTRLQQIDQGTAADVYVIPAEGGEPRRITYFGTPYTRVVGWTPDGGSSYTATSRRLSLSGASSTRSPSPGSTRG